MLFCDIQGTTPFVNVPFLHDSNSKETVISWRLEMAKLFHMLFDLFEAQSYARRSVCSISWWANQSNSKDAYENVYIRSKSAAPIDLLVFNSKRHDGRRVIFLRDDRSVWCTACFRLLFVGLKKTYDGSWSVSSYLMFRLGSLLVRVLFYSGLTWLVERLPRFAQWLNMEMRTVSHEA